MAPPVSVEPLPMHPGEGAHYVGRCRDGVLALVTVERSWDLPDGGRLYRLSFMREDESHLRGGFYLWDDDGVRRLRGWDPGGWPQRPLWWPEAGT